MGNTELELPRVTSSTIESVIVGKREKFSRLESKTVYERYQWIKHNYEEDEKNFTYISARVKSNIKNIAKIGVYEGSIFGFLISDLYYPFVIMSCNNNSYRKSINAIKEYNNSVRSTTDEKALFLPIHPEILFTMVEDKEWKTNWVYVAKFNSQRNENFLDFNDNDELL